MKKGHVADKVITPPNRAAGRKLVVVGAFLGVVGFLLFFLRYPWIWIGSFMIMNAGILLWTGMFTSQRGVSLTHDKLNFFGKSVNLDNLNNIVLVTTIMRKSTRRVLVLSDTDSRKVEIELDIYKDDLYRELFGIIRTYLKGRDVARNKQVDRLLARFK